MPESADRFLHGARLPGAIAAFSRVPWSQPSRPPAPRPPPMENSTDILEWIKALLKKRSTGLMLGVSCQMKVSHAVRESSTERMVRGHCVLHPVRQVHQLVPARHKLADGRQVATKPRSFNGCLEVGADLANTRCPAAAGTQGGRLGGDKCLQPTEQCDGGRLTSALSVQFAVLSLQVIYQDLLGAGGRAAGRVLRAAAACASAIPGGPAC